MAGGGFALTCSCPASPWLHPWLTNGMGGPLGAGDTVAIFSAIGGACAVPIVSTARLDGVCDVIITTPPPPGVDVHTTAPSPVAPWVWPVLLVMAGPTQDPKSPSSRGVAPLWYTPSQKRYNRPSIHTSLCSSSFQAQSPPLPLPPKPAPPPPPPPRPPSRSAQCHHAAGGSGKVPNET